MITKTGATVPTSTKRVDILDLEIPKLSPEQVVVKFESSGNTSIMPAVLSVSQKHSGKLIIIGNTDIVKHLTSK